MLFWPEFNEYVVNDEIKKIFSLYLLISFIFSLNRIGKSMFKVDFYWYF